MKKLLAILLSVLMLCTMVPFATVAAADEPTIQVSATVDDEPVEALDAGDEFQVTVNLLNIPDPGLIGAQVEIVYDHDVFELVTYFDEDEEAWLPQIEVGSKYNASTNKYITFGPIDEETGESQNCLVQYLRATAKETQVRYEEHYFTATFKVKDDAVSGTYDLIADKYQGGNTVTFGNGSVGDLFTVENASVTVNGVAAGCEHEYDNDCDVDCNLCGETREVSHNVIHVEAKDPTCDTEGNIEYWYCDICGQAWLDEYCHLNTNLRAVILPATGEHTYDGEYDADCNVCGEIREVASPISCVGKAVSEDVTGLAFLFNADVIMEKPETNIAVYAGSKIVINGVEYNLKGMGALVSLNSDMSNSSKVAAKNLYNWEENAVQFAVRVREIPEDELDTIIYAQDYYVLDNGVTIYGDIVSSSYNAVLNAQ